jgi:hypothetical protein
MAGILAIRAPIVDSLRPKRYSSALSIITGSTSTSPIIILFDLRDADSLNQDIPHQLRILRNDYTPKPGFEVYRQLIDELGRGRAKISEKRELEDP